MRIYTPAGDLAFKTFTFPDGQPHFKLETTDVDFRSVTIESAIRNPSELFLVLQTAKVLRSSGYTDIRLDVRYLLGARMDRAISQAEPFTLELVAQLVNSAGFSKVRILDAHSEVATRLIRNSVNVLPHAVVDQVLCTLGRPAVIIPDKGAFNRVSQLVASHSGAIRLLRCKKEREMSTGAIKGFEVDRSNMIFGVPFKALIVDDICDGGGTFTGLAKELKMMNPQISVSLFVTHGIFSKGLPLEGIDRVFTTNSYTDWDYNEPFVTSIPISMKEIQ